MTNLEFAELSPADACRVFEEAAASNVPERDADSAIVTVESSVPHLPVMWIDPNGCTQFHYFARDEAGNLQGFHSDESLCELVEFNLAREAA